MHRSSRYSPNRRCAVRQYARRADHQGRDIASSSQRDRLTRPSVGLIPKTELTDAGQKIEPSVSVPTATAARLAAMATADPELEPQGETGRTYGLRHCPPRALQPLEECGERKLAHSLMFVLPSSTAPASRSCWTTKASCRGRELMRTRDPAVVSIWSAVSMLSLSKTGIPCKCPRGPR